jgi:hypothetical protein
MFSSNQETNRASKVIHISLVFELKTVSVARFANDQTTPLYLQGLYQRKSENEMLGYLNNNMV